MADASDLACLLLLFDMLARSESAFEKHAGMSQVQSWRVKMSFHRIRKAWPKMPGRTEIC